MSVGLEALFGRQFGEQDAPKKSPPDVLVVTLREVFREYVKPCPYKPGDLVTPRKGSNRHGVGDPCIVLEVLEKPVRLMPSEVRPSELGGPAYGAIIDMRVLHEMHGTLVAHMEESWMFEPYVGQPDTSKPSN